MGDISNEIKREAEKIMNKLELDDVKENIMYFISFVLENIHRPIHLQLLEIQNKTANVDKEELQERFERVVHSTLLAYSNIIPSISSSIDLSILSKHLNSPRVSFRR